jgi:hypothetical protein
MTIRRIAFAVLVGASLAYAPSCQDPVHNAEVDALGGEAAGVSPGPNHRPGQPCLTCHGGRGPANAEFSVAGTIFKTADAREGIAGVHVTLSDSTPGTAVTKAAVTNVAGNFYIGTNFAPVFPLHDIKLDFEGLPESTIMHTRVGREGSCGACHFDPSGGTTARDTPGHIYLVLEAGDLPGAGP